MGAWNYGPFGNDDAVEWVSELGKSTGLTLVEEAIGAVSDFTDDYLEAPICSVAIAAGEIVAALMENSTQEFPRDVQAWIRSAPVPSAELVARSRMAIDAVLESSELQELWSEAVEYQQWLATVLNLRSRLG